MKKMVSFRIDEDSIQKLDLLSERMEMSRTDVVVSLINSYDDGEAKGNTVSGEVVSSLLRQLEEKDSQIQNKDEQINQLMEQCRNFQVLLKGEQDKQVLFLPAKKVGLFRRLFGRNEESDD